MMPLWGQLVILGIFVNIAFSSADVVCVLLASSIVRYFNKSPSAGRIAPRIQSINTNESFTVNLKNVDIHTLIETVSSRTGKNFIVDPRVQATVTVISSEPVDVVFVGA